MTESAAITWSVPECPFTISTSARVLDDIRLAVTDAFFSLPRGGAEIGGILLGTYRDDKLLITDYAALDCEHAYGPSFQLSPPDEERLTQLLAAHDGCAGGPRPVGWYHSHTRTEIFLSDTDLGIYRRFFPEAWQVALVLRPHTFEPTRYGFFFRQADGAVYARGTRREERLEALPVRQVPAGPPSAAEPPAPQPRNLRPQTLASVVDLPPFPMPAPSAPVSEPAAAQPAHPLSPSPFLVPAHSSTPSPFAVPSPTSANSPESVPMPSPFAVPAPATPFSPAQAPPASPFAVPPPSTLSSPSGKVDGPTGAAAASAREESIPQFIPPVPAELPVPAFAVESASAARNWMTLGIAIVGGLGVVAASYKTQEFWLPRVMAAIHPSQSAAVTPGKPAAAATTLGLVTHDRDGQLQIYWDRSSAAIRDAAYGVLEITEDGTVPQVIQLDAASLQNGSFTYQRNTSKVDLKLLIRQKAGPDLRESASFLGKPPDTKAKEEAEALKQRESEAIQQRDEMAKQAAKMKADLNAQSAKTKKLEKDMQSIVEEMRQQQQRRLTNQVPDK